MGRAVDQPRKDDSAPRVDAAGVGVGCEELRLGPDRSDRIANDEDSGVPENRVLVIQSQNRTVVHQQIRRVTGFGPSGSH